MIVLVIVGFIVAMDCAYRSWRDYRTMKSKKL
jgi:hypothetical protein